ncbi:Flagellar M-ring protein [Paraliobacillus sp. PM-2]|uniref:flagellar basal-body MS-ring/collar protein FliF n=1 Tax=Paraliobacillus sp. PM-2 TaxID=1462524 RepID=UPI00061C5E56|nr:flagellar basal-body MS-ring/collar protein FliF [Paraliobacillus sp. PM-2]CQR47702.1 Flagellar M-ring protein [Paraliobacillus sp. PM-2]
MKQKVENYKNNIIDYWQGKSSKQKGFFFSMILLFLVIVVGGTLLLTKSNMVALYNNLSIQEIGQIKAELDTRGIKYELKDAGSTIMVPSDQADTLLVDLAAQGIPDSGSIDYSFFSENTSWGMTDNEFDVMKLDAMQTELAGLITGISGIEDATVMINLPQEQVFISENQQTASASVVLTTTPGYQFNEKQINSLYHLVSKTVPNLPTENIVIMDQNFNYYDQNGSTNFTNGDTYTTQQQIKQDIERDIQRRVQQLLGTMIGANKVVASVTADIDFTQENRIEEIVEPVNQEDKEGLPVSVETITETYTGEGAQAAGEAGVGNDDIANYPASEDGNSGEYEMVQESINYEFDSITREIVESPYKIRDLGIQIAVDNTKETLDANGEPELLTAQEQANVEASIASILHSIISTSVAEPYGDINPQEKTSIVFQTFNGTQTQGQHTVTPAIPTWVYVTGAILLIGIIVLLLILFKKNKQEDEVVSEEVNIQQEIEIPNIEEPADTESSIRRKQLEKMAKDKPEEFAKLLRSWIAED